MNKKYGKQQKTSYKSIIFWGLIALITLIFIIVIIVRFAQSRTVNSYDSLKQLQGEEILEQSDKYLVFVYNSTTEKSSEIDNFDKVVFNYISFAKRNKSNESVFKIFGFDIVNPDNKKVVISSDSGKTANISNVEDFSELLIKSGDIPMLLIISGNKIIDYKDSDNAISEYLQNIIDENK